MALKVPAVTEIAYKTYMINLFGLQCVSLLVGQEKAMLIDTGVGNYDLRSLVKSLTDLPLTVVITHGHGDHIGGIGQFQEIYAHPADCEMIRNYDRITWADRYVREMVANDKWGCFDYPEGYVKWDYQPEFKPLYDGQVFDLGGRRVAVLEAPGHTKGEVVLIDETNRILFSGDAVNSNLGIRGTSVAEALNGLKHVKAHEAMFDRNFTGHLGWAGNLSMAVSEGPSTLNTLLSICEGILAGTLQGEIAETERHGTQCTVTVDGIRINYPPHAVWEKIQ